VPAEGLLGAARLAPPGPPSKTPAFNLAGRPSCRTRLVVCRGFEWKTSSGGNLERFSEIFEGICRLRVSHVNYFDRPVKIIVVDYSGIRMSGITDCFVSVYKNRREELPRKVTPREGRYYSRALDAPGVRVDARTGASGGVNGRAPERRTQSARVNAISWNTKYQGVLGGHCQTVGATYRPVCAYFELGVDSRD
jgi:hypothetical protein